VALNACVVQTQRIAFTGDCFIIFLNISFHVSLLHNVYYVYDGYNN